MRQGASTHDSVPLTVGGEKVLELSQLAHEVEVGRDEVSSGLEVIVGVVEGQV